MRLCCENRIENMKRKGRTKRIILRITAVFLLLIIAGGVFLYYNLNRLLTNALTKSFNSNIISDVYELKFEKLSVNLFSGNVSVYNVKLNQLENSLHDYPYINSSLLLSTQKMILKNVQIMNLIRTNILMLDKIEIIEPEVKFRIENKIPVFFPFKDTTATKVKKTNKRFIEAFVLKEFNMVNASFHSDNLAKERDINISNVDFSLRDLVIDQQPGRDILSYKNVHISVGEFTRNLKKKAVKNLHFKDFKIYIDSLHVEQTTDTSIYHFADFSTGLKELDLQTADSLFHLTMQSFDVSYKDRSIKLSGVVFKPNVSDARLQARFPYQHAHFSGSVNNLNMVGVNFDSLIRKGKILIDEMNLDKVSAAIFKDNTKPVDKNRIPQFLGQSIKAIKPPLFIKQINATNVTLVNRERNPDGSYATAHLNRSRLEVKNMTNLPTREMLTLKADAYLENKAHVNATLNFDYTKPQFSFNGRVQSFNLPDLNQLIQAYTPASIHKGTMDEMTFSGIAHHTRSSGTMKFLYHDLDVDIDLEGKAKWKSTVISFGANTVVPSANPAEDKPQRIVTFQVERNMYKSFINLLIKSVLAGLKETMIMSKENKQTYREKKRELKKEKKKQDKKKKS